MEEPDIFFNADAFERASAFARKGGAGNRPRGGKDEDGEDDHQADLDDMLLGDMDSGIFFNDSNLWDGSNGGKGSSSGGQGGSSGDMLSDKGGIDTSRDDSRSHGMGPPPPLPPAMLSSKNVSSLPSNVHSGLSSFLASGPPLWKPSNSSNGGNGGGAALASSGGSSSTPATMAHGSNNAGNSEGGGLRSRSYSFNALMDDTASILSSDSSSIWGLDQEGSSHNNTIPSHYQMGPASMMFPSPSSSRSGRGGARRKVGGAGSSSTSQAKALAEAVAGLDAASIGVGGEVSVKRKQDRNAREQKRSLKISQQIGHLKEVLEKDGKKVKNSKMAILLSVQHYIKELEGEISSLSLSRDNYGGSGGGGSSSSGCSMAGDDMSVGGGNGKDSGMLSLGGFSSTGEPSCVLSTAIAAGSDQEVANGVGFHSLFKQVSTPLAVASMDGRFIDTNIRFEMATGYSKEELSRLTFFNLVAPDDLQETFATVARMINSPGDEGLQARLTRKAMPKPSGVGWAGGGAAAVGLGNGGAPLSITISLVRQNAVPQFFQCSLH